MYLTSLCIFENAGYLGLVCTGTFDSEFIEGFPELGATHRQTCIEPLAPGIYVFITLTTGRNINGECTFVDVNKTDCSTTSKQT